MAAVDPLRISFLIFFSSTAAPEEVTVSHSLLLLEAILPLTGLLDSSQATFNQNETGYQRRTI